MTSTYNSDLSPADYLFPSHLQIEIIAGICSADCIMCTINSVSRKGILNISSYTTILDKFSTHLNKIKHLSLFGMGEPLLDPTLAEKIAIAKQKGFSNIGFATNLTHLTAEKADSLLTAGLDTIIFSIDGINKITHEKIRRGTNYDEILNNALRFIDARNTKQNKTKQNKTKIILRMIRQDINRSEWEEYKAFWENALNPTFGDQVSVFDVHNWGGDFDCKESQFSYGFFEELHELSRKTRFVCPELIERFFILLNGDVALCCGDENATLNIGNIFSEDPYSIFNGVIFRKYRSFMQEGRLAELERCSACSVPFSKMKSLYLDVK